MKRAESPVSPWTPRALYIFAFVLILVPLVDLGTSVLPARLGDFSWRYGFFGLAAGYLHTPMLGLVLAMGVAYWREDVGVLRFTALLAGLSSVALVLAMGIFALDVLQMRGMREDEVKGLVLAGGMVQELKYLTAFLVLAPLGHGVWRTAARMGKGERTRAEGGSGIVARPGA